MGAAEDLVNNTEGAAGQENHTGPTENPINDNTSSSENPVKDKALVAENPVIDHASDAKISEAGGAENSAYDKAESGAGNLANDQLNGAVNIVNYVTDGTGGNVTEKTDVEQNSASKQMGITENMVNDITNYQAGQVENHINDQTDVAQLNPASEQASRVENPLINLADGAGDSTNDEAGGAEDSVSNKPGATEKFKNDKSGEQNPINNNEDAVETPKTSKGNSVETPVSNKVDRLPEDAKQILKSMASKWEDVLDENTLQVIPLKGAMTNEVFQIKWPTTTGETSRKVILRMYGEGVEVFFNRDDEIRTFEFMSKNGQGPRLLGRFTNGRVEEFIHARTLSAPDLRDPSISALIAAKLKEFHDLDMPGEKNINLWHRLRNWLKEAKHLSSPKEVEAFYLDTIDKEISILEKELSSTKQRIGFCHNDLQYGNIMLDEETNSVTIIDYEYASYNPVAFDIANHFCEMAANYHTEEPHILDYNLYPDFEERKRFVLAYLSTSGEQPSNNEVEQLLHEIEKYTLANHLFWGVWGIISAQVNTIEFDYKEYAKQRFQEYWARKPYLLINSESPSPYNAPEGTGDVASAGPVKSKNPGIFRKMKKVLGLSLFRSKN